MDKVFRGLQDARPTPEEVRTFAVGLQPTSKEEAEAERKVAKSVLETIYNIVITKLAELETNFKGLQNKDHMTHISYLAAKNELVELKHYIKAEVHKADIEYHYSINKLGK